MSALLVFVSILLSANLVFAKNVMHSCDTVSGLNSSGKIALIPNVKIIINDDGTGSVTTPKGMEEDRLVQESANTPAETNILPNVLKSFGYPVELNDIISIEKHVLLPAKGVSNSPRVTVLNVNTKNNDVVMIIFLGIVPATCSTPTT